MSVPARARDRWGELVDAITPWLAQQGFTLGVFG